MYRETLCKNIAEKLNFLAYHIKRQGKLNLLDTNIFAETFFANLMNHLFGYNFKNINQEKQNTEAIDLIDYENKIIAQVSSTYTKQKIENSLNKESLKGYHDYRFFFIAITENTGNLRKKVFKNPYNVKFSSANDIYDITSLLNIINNLEIDKLQSLNDFIEKELGKDINIVKMDSNLTIIINLLSQENLSVNTNPPNINTFEIERKIDFNKLTSIRSIFDEYKIYFSKINEKYKEFDKIGNNKSISVLSVIHNKYIKLSTEISDPKDLFFAIIDSVVDTIINSKNYVSIPQEELEMCVYILVVDAFIRCKIFENPEDYNYVIT